MLKTDKKGRVNGAAITVVISFLIITAVLIAVIVMLFNSGKQFGKAVNKVDYAEQVYRYSAEYQLNPNLVFAIIKTESNFNTNAESQAGAKGLMQIMPSSFEWLQRYNDGEEKYSTDNLYDPDINIRYGCVFLRFLLDRYTVERSAVAAYNAGFGNVDSWLESTEYSSDGKNLSRIPYSETASYVDKVENYKRYYESNISQEYIVSGDGENTPEISDDISDEEVSENLSESSDESSEDYNGYSYEYSDDEELSEE